MDTDEIRTILAACISGHDGAIERLIRLYETDVYRLALALLNDSQEAHEAAQDAFIAALTQLKRYQERTSFKAWLLTITLNISRDRLRTHRTQARLFQSLIANIKLSSPHSASLEDQTLTKERNTTLQQALEQLSEKHRTVIILRYFQGLTIAEMNKRRDHTFEVIHGPSATQSLADPAGEIDMSSSTHVKIHTLLQVAIDRTLTSREQSVLADHLSTCGECNRYATEIGQIRDIIRNDVSPDAAPHLNHAAIKSGAQILYKRQKGFALLGRFATAAAAVALIGLLVFRNNDELRLVTPIVVSEIPQAATFYANTPSPTTTAAFTATTCATRAHIIQAGETLTTIAAYYGVPPESLDAYNSATGLQNLTPGQTLYIPACGEATFTPTLTSTSTYSPSGN